MNPNFIPSNIKAERYSYILGMGCMRSSVPNGVYIEDTFGNLHGIHDWNKLAYIPNSIAVVTQQHSFRIALYGFQGLSIDIDPYSKLETKLDSVKSKEKAKVYYNGSEDTVKYYLNEGLAAGYCHKFMLPNGETGCYLPSIGELYLAWCNMDDITSALVRCGGTLMFNAHYWSSTFYGKKCGNYPACWTLDWPRGAFDTDSITAKFTIRPFAPLIF